MVEHAGLFVCVNVLIEDYGSEQCETSENTDCQRAEKIRGERRKEGEPGKYRVPADIGHSVLQETMSECLLPEAHTVEVVPDSFHHVA